MIIHGDCLDKMKDLDDNSIDLILTDPPYGYKFMNSAWDKAVPSVDIWQECLRILKPGAFCMVMSAPRSDVQMHMISNLTQAGFRLDFTPIYWTYASGFPKATNIAKQVDKRQGAEREVLGTYKTGYSKSQKESGYRPNEYELKTLDPNPITDDAKALDGSYAGFQPKPAVEVIIVAMKPLSEKTFVDQAIKNGHGITWLDDCRIPIGEHGEDKRLGGKGEWNIKRESSGNTVSLPAQTMGSHEAGRFPANLLVSDDVLNDGRTTKGGSGKEYFDDYERTWKNTSKDGIRVTSFPDSGSYSRYFDLDKWATTLPFLIVPKASKSEKNAGLEDRPEQFRKTLDGGSMATEGKWTEDPTGSWQKNHHPTVKPLKLMSYLITLGSREGDLVLDPFCGSGTTCVAAKKLRRKYIGIEREAEYVEIARARLEADKQVTLL